MNKNLSYLFNPNDDTIVRSIRAFGLSYLQVEETKHLDVIDEHNKLREEFLSNGSEPIDVIEEELKTVNWIEIKNNFNNINDNNKEIETYTKYNMKDDLLLQQQQQTNQINTTMYFKKISPFDLKKRERRSRSISQSTMDNHCVFCSNNNEPPEVVRSHSVRDIFGRVLCPKLRTYVCPICNSSGDSAHTVKYCPKKPVITMEDSIMLENIKYNEMLKKFEKFR